MKIHKKRVVDGGRSQKKGMEMGSRAKVMHLPKDCSFLHWDRKAGGRKGTYFSDLVEGRGRKLRGFCFL